MTSQYIIKDDSIVSFSGGRTSGYMLKQILDAHNGVLPDNIKVVFANTGKEMPETLDFVQACSENWNVQIIRLECLVRKSREDEKNKYVYETVIVDHKTASRNGEPFASLIAARSYAPNPVARFCTQELKILRIKKWGNDTFGHKDWVSIVGLRADEPRRVAKMIDRDDVITPLAPAKVSKEIVGEFWRNQAFDLNLPNNNGTTDLGNCDLCFLKGAAKKLSIIESRPDLADWWVEQEASLSKKVGKAATFRKDGPTYAEMQIIARSQESFVFDTGIEDCFCTD